MEKKYFFLEPKENSRVMKIVQIVFGITCITISLSWIIFKFKTLQADKTYWITIIFLIGFGLYEILAGTGKTEKYIETGPEKIVIKQNSVLPKIELKPSDIERIELFPLSIIFCLVNRKKVVFRFGLTYTEIIDPVKEEIITFAEKNNIQTEVKKEEI